MLQRDASSVRVDQKYPTDRRLLGRSIYIPLT